MNRFRAAALAAAAALCAFTALPARADFADVVRAVESKAGGHRTPIPLFGLVRLAVWVAHPDGVHDIEIATWEGARDVIDARDVGALLRSKAGANYRPIVTTHSRNGEWTYICARPGSAGLMELIVLSHDREDTVALRAVVEPRVMAREFGDKSRHHHHGVAFAEN